jgi:Tol biopolymer transport system component
VKNRWQIAMVTAAAALGALLLVGSEPGLGQVPVDDKTRAAAQALADFERTAGVLTVYDRQGKIVRTVGERAIHENPAFSPDGKRVAVTMSDGGQGDIWVYDVATGASTRITSDPANETWPVWSPDGSQIVFASNRGRNGLYRKAADGTGSEELLYRPSGAILRITDWSADGRFLTYYDLTSLYVLPVTGPGERKAIVVDPNRFQARGGRFSPDGRFLAYAAEAPPGQGQVWVRPFDPSAPGAGEPQLIFDEVSPGGMIFWRQDGRELYFRAADGGVMAVEVNTAPVFTSEKPRFLFKAPDPSPPHP